MYLVQVGPTKGRGTWTVLAIADRSGRSFVDELRKADPSDYEALGILAMVERDIPNEGPPRQNTPRSKALGEGLFELRRGRFRVLWFYDGGANERANAVICSHSFTKKGQRAKGTPPQEIAKARKQRKRYIQAKREGVLRLLRPPGG